MTDLALDPRPVEDVRARTNARLGMAIFIGSWSMGVAVLIVSFLVLRTRQQVWPPEGVMLPDVILASVGTALLLLSSLTAHLAVRRLRAGQGAVLGLWTTTLVLGLAFSVLQAMLWADLWTAGRQPWRTGIYESLFYGLTWFHAAHVACGLIGLTVGLGGLLTGRYGAHRTATVTNLAVFWHFVDVVWILLFFCFFAL